MEDYKNLTQGELDYEFINACRDGNLEIVKYLLTSPYLKKHANIHTNDDYGFMFACANGHLEIVKYLLTSHDLKDYSNIYAFNCCCFMLACANCHLDIVKYLIFDIDIKKTYSIKEFLKDDKYKEIEKMFNMIELNKQLKNELNNKNENTNLKRNKI